MSYITTPFSLSSTAAELAAGMNMLGKRVVVTGGASGIGWETARALAHIGADVTLAVRNVAAGKTAAENITAITGNHDVRVVQLNLVDRASVAAFVAAWDGPLHVLVNNAGVMALPTLQHTPDEWEMQFAANFLGHFALTLGLHRALVAAGNARVVMVSSSAHLGSPVVFDDVHFAFRPYDPFLAYAQSKTAMILFAVALTARWGDAGITANALHPGAILTDLQHYTSGLQSPPERRKTLEQGAATTVLLAASPLLDGIGGRYFEDCNQAHEVMNNNGYASGVAPYATNPEDAQRLWEISRRMLVRNLEEERLLRGT